MTTFPTATTSPTSLGRLNADDFSLTPQEADDYAVARLRSVAFDAVYELWRDRQAHGMTQKMLSEALGRDPGWVSRALRGPANWEFKTFARLVRALKGEAEIVVRGLEEPLGIPDNYHAYRAREAGVKTSPKSNPVSLVPIYGPEKTVRHAIMTRSVA